ncbi:MAG: cytochrome c biogenesis protein DipZ [Candidatus Nanopelagicales bacterium]|nr:cytochrome c biogenesis protein DipZ [Candidatus Nanopelagicales bacterium]
MLTLTLIGLLAGIVTGLSPCILPVLPAVLATTAIPAGLLKPGEAAPPPDRRRPFIVIGGLVTSFALFTLIGGSLLAALGLPADLLRNIGIIAMLVVGIGFLLPAVGHLLERPFARFSRVGPRRSGSAFLFGATFGLAFVPCAGPVLATITVLAATNQVNAGLIVLTVAFSVGVAIPLLAFALAGQQMASRISVIRSHMPVVRRVTGAVLVATALAVAWGFSDQLQRLVPSYVASAQQQIEGNPAAKAALGSLQAAPSPVATGLNAALGPQRSFDECSSAPERLANCGPAPAFTGIGAWLNTPGNAPLSLAGLQGKVVLVDFWTYSCINCQRTLPYLTAWDAKYREAGLVVVGVHSPEFAFERDIANVTDQAAKLGVRYPVAIDNDFATWQNYQQRYWPAHYLIDQTGTVRQVHYGEGAYDQTEALITQLLGMPETAPPATTRTPAPDPDRPQGELALMSGRTAETYLGSARADAYVNRDYQAGASRAFSAPSQIPANAVALSGTWTVEPERITAGSQARLLLRYSANVAHLVLAGKGRVGIDINGRPQPAIDVKGAPTLYTLHVAPERDALMTLTLAPGVSAYAFTFG